MALLLTCGAAASARAQPKVSDKVLLIRPVPPQPGFPALEQRTRAELEAAGFAVLIAEAPDDVDLFGLSTQHHALAALHIKHDGTRRVITVQVVDRVTAKSSTRELDADLAQRPERLALRAVELLYASLLELETTAALGGDVTATPLVTRVARDRLLARESAASCSVQAQAFAVSGSGGVGTLAGLELGATHYLLPLLGISATIAATAPTTVREADSSALFALSLARLDVVLEPWPMARLSPALEARGGLIGALASGDSNSGAPTRTDWGASAYWGGALTLATRVQRDLRLRGAIELSHAFQPLEVRFAGERAAQFGSLWLGVGLGLQWLY